MTTLLSQINSACADAFAACGFDTKFAAVRESDRPDMADFQCNGALPIGKMQKQNPMDVADQIVAALADNPLVTVEAAKPGFLNFRVRDAGLAAQIKAVSDDPRSLAAIAADPLKILVDYGGPNVAKDMHVGHLRAAIIGQALKTILRFGGHDADGDVHLGDWGLQMGQLIAFIEDQHPDLLTGGDITMTDLQAWYPQASTLSKTDEAFRDKARAATMALQAGQAEYYALWERMRAASVTSLKRDYDWLGVQFEYWNGESKYQAALDAMVDTLQASGVAELDDGAMIIRTSDNGKLPPLILRNSNGAYGYGATDVATIQDRVSDAALQLILYVVDARQATHFKQVFKSCERAGYLDTVGAEHIQFGTVNGTDGKPFKTRAGGTMRLADLIAMMVDAVRARIDAAGQIPEADRAEVAQTVAQAAIKFGELSHDREKNYVFDIDQFAQFEGKTGPYLQYTCVRIQTLLDAAAADGKVAGDIAEIGDGGRHLALALDAFPAAIEKSIKSRKPSHLANHAYRIAEAANGYYQKNRVLSAGVTASNAATHLAVLTAAQRQLQLALDLLGIDVPAKM